MEYIIVLLIYIVLLYYEKNCITPRKKNRLGRICGRREIGIAIDWR